MAKLAAWDSGETVLAESLDLLEAAFGEVFGVTPGDHAIDQLLAVLVDSVALALPGGHGASEAVCLVRRETRGDDGELHGLLLKQRHTERAFQRLADLFARVVHRLLALTAPEVRVDHAALDRAGADDGDLDDQVVEAARLEARGASTSAPGSRSGTRRACPRG